MEQHSLEPISTHNNDNMLIGDLEAEFHDVTEELPFVNTSHATDTASDQFLSDSEHDTSSIDGESAIYFLSEHTPDSPASVYSSGLRRRRPISDLSSEDLDFSQSQFFKKNPDGLIDFDRRSLPGSHRKKYKRSWSDRTGSQSLDGSPLHSGITSVGSYRAITRVESNGAITSVGSNRSLNYESSSLNSPDSSQVLLLTLAGLVLKAFGFQNQLISSSLTLPIWIMKLSFILMSDPVSIAYEWIKKQKFSWNSFIPTFHGLLCLVYGFFILVGLIALPLLLSSTTMKWLISQPEQITEELIFDYSKDTPMAFVPIISCSNISSPGLIEKSTESQILQFDREVQATVSLTLPESDYNRNLGVFQVRVDFLSGDGKPLATIQQPAMFPFRSEPIRILSTFLKLAPVIAGYSSETQTLEITFKGYREKNVTTSCSRVVLEHRAEFERGGGLPEIYAASLKLEAQHPYWKRVLWYWKSVIYMGMISMMFTVELMFMLLCCPIVFPGQRPRVGVSLDNIGASGKTLHRVEV